LSRKETFIVDSGYFKYIKRFLSLCPVGLAVLMSTL